MEIQKRDNCTIKFHKNKLYFIIDIDKFVGFTQHGRSPVLCSLPFQIIQFGIHRFFFKLFIGRSKKQGLEKSEMLEKLEGIINP